ncbi:MAG: Gfo/Idh/MocA family oxidoreductase, partial [Bryobacteraceae bacterium]
VFTCATQLVPFQTMQVLGTRGRIEMEIPYNIPPDRPSRIFIDDGSQLAGRGAQIEEFATCDAYTAQGDAFARAIQEGVEAPVPLEDAMANMAVIDTIFRSAETRQWEKV